MAGWEAVIGLEIHAQLRTRSKLFCGCAVSFGREPNSLTCPVCLGFPGALPVLNSQAVDLAVKAALALGCRINPVSVFARKNYFYPDLPKGYQITQYDMPLATGGALEWTNRGRRERVGLVRLHLEEDAGKSFHADTEDGVQATSIDFNRSGVPLVEIVTEPEIRTPALAAAFYQRLRILLVAIGASDGNMEEGSLRCDANISVRRAGSHELGTRTEVKNLNSFRFLQRALEYEFGRQVRAIEDGRDVITETRSWDEGAGVTVPLRSKEEAEDYRYFPEPDLPPLTISRERLDELARSLPELPEARAERYRRVLSLPEDDAWLIAQSAPMSDYFESTARLVSDPRDAANWIIGELTHKLKETGDAIERAPVEAASLAALVRMVENEEISGPTAKAVFEEMYATGRSASDIVREKRLEQISDRGALEVIVREVAAASPSAVADYRSGKRKAFGFLVGQVMKATSGRANPRIVNELLTGFLNRSEP